jgi:hypothetical protein
MQRPSCLLILATTHFTAGCSHAAPKVEIITGETIVTVEVDGCCDDDCCDEDDCCDDDCDTGLIADTGDTGDGLGCALVEPYISEFELLDECAYDPTPVDIEFAPVVEWAWAPETSDTHPYVEVMTSPVAGNLTDDNGDGLINDNDVPDVVFTAFSGLEYHSALGALVVLSGDDGTELQYITQFLLPDGTTDYAYAGSGVALGDIDNDGIPEMCFTSIKARIICMTEAGALTMVGEKPSGWDNRLFQHSNISIGNIDGRGDAEISVGRAVYNASGTLVSTGGSDNGTHAWWSAMSFMADVVPGGDLELVAGSTVYDSAGNIVWDGGSDGFSAMADLDLDGFPELVVVHDRAMSVYNASGGLLAAVSFSNCGDAAYCGGPPTLADFDGDGFPEIGHAGSQEYTVWDYDSTTGLSVLWANAIEDTSSGSTGAAVFDFEDDGIAEVVFADEERLYVWRGTDGSDQLGAAGFDPELHTSGTVSENPILLDVDNDSSTEIIIASNHFLAYRDSTTTTDWRGVRSIGSGEGTPWADSRPVWNQHAYSMTHINDDLSVPMTQVDSWSDNNTFRAAQQTSIEELPGDYQADLTVLASYDWCFDCGADTIEVWFSYANQGLAASERTTAAFMIGDIEIEVVDIAALEPGEAMGVGPVTLDIGVWQLTPGAELELLVDGGNVVSECDEANNSGSSVGVSIAYECE